MEETVIATREILWNISESLKITTYSMLAVALLVFIRGVWLGTLSLTRKISKTFSGGLIPNASSLQWRQFFKLFFHWQVIRDHSVGFFHSLIFYGFVILWIATDLLFTIIPLSKYFQV